MLSFIQSGVMEGCTLIRLMTIFLIYSTSQCRASVLYVRPTEGSNTSCPHSPCLTLNEYANSSETYFKSNTIFLFLPGVHQLDSPVVFEQLTNISLLALDDELSVQLMPNNSCHMNDSENRLYENDVFCSWSLLNFQRVERITLKCLSVWSVASGAVLLNQTAEVIIQHCNFTCVGETLNSSGVIVANAFSTTTDSVHTSNCSTGISLLNSNLTTISNKVSQYCTKAGVFVYESSNTSLYNITEFSSCNGIIVVGSENTMIVESNISGTENIGICINSSENVYIYNVEITHSKLYGVVIENSCGLIINNITALYCSMNIALLHLTLTFLAVL